MKQWVFIVAIWLFCLPAMAKHVAGGELFYEYLGAGGPGQSTYRITLRLFRDCGSSGPMLEVETPSAGVYENGRLKATYTLPRITNPVLTISLNTTAFSCLVGQVQVCYQMALYSTTITLEDNQAGYTLSRVSCCRIDNVSNLSLKRNVGANYITYIPGSLALPTGHNSSPQFNVRDTALVCADKFFKLDFGANDPDNDSLTFEFCDAYASGVSGGNIAPPPAGLTLMPLPYIYPFSGVFPLGSAVVINPLTGVISGIAPVQGQYVVNVCVKEWRNGMTFSEHRKDFILKVQDCDIIEAALPDKIVQCNSLDVYLENQSTSSAITSYAWDFGNSGLPGNFSNNPTAQYTYSDTGKYIAKLHVTGPNGCEGSDSTIVWVYPGFTPGFKVLGSCFQSPYQFTDTSFAKYGSINGWRWNFGDETTTSDTSILQHPKYKYDVASTMQASLIVTSSKGCIDTANFNLKVLDKPSLVLSFKDTVICSIDTLPITVGNSGSISWKPGYNIIGANTPNPLVFPKDTTRYIVTVNDNGCINTDTVTVNVLDFIDVFAGRDSAICSTDTIQFRPVSHGLQYLWSSSSGEPVVPKKFPVVRPLVNTSYYVVANLGKCQDMDTINIATVSYPVVSVGRDTSICFGRLANLHGSAKASSFAWTPTVSLSNTRILHPIATPTSTTRYVLSVSDTLGCPKIVTDTVMVFVSPMIHAHAGSDTTIVPNQPLQLEASGGRQYNWSPEFGLSDASISNPVTILDKSIDSILYRVRVLNDSGCYADDEVMVRVYKHHPDILLPTAFTPNDDGKNDILKPILVGITTFQYFKLYNRWGQLVFNTSQPGKGWNGVYNGAKQPSTTYVYHVEGIDFMGKKVYRKGAVVLIR